MKICVIPDTQVTPQSTTHHLKWAGKYVAEKQPEVIVHIGDHWDMESLCAYDKGKKGFEGRKITQDIRAGIKAMDVFLKPIQDLQERQRRNSKKMYKPRMIFTLGNHENRINRAVEESRELEDLISIDSLCLKERGWEVHDFLEVVEVNGVLFSHFFVSGIMGRPVTSPAALIRKKHMSCVMGHVQDRGIHEERRGDGKRITGIFAGIFYQGDQTYLNPQTNGSWSGIWFLHEVQDGQFDYMAVSTEYLRGRYK